MSDTVDIRRLLLIEERGKAMLVEQNGKRVWLPRSQIDYIKRHPATVAGQEIDIRIPDWLADEKGLE